jgi:hypothetical protein
MWINNIYVITHLGLESGMKRLVTKDIYVIVITQMQVDMQVIFFTLTLSIFATCITFSMFIITCIGFWKMNIWVSLYGKGCWLPCEISRREISYSWGDG